MLHRWWIFFYPSTQRCRYAFCRCVRAKSPPPPPLHNTTWEDEDYGQRRIALSRPRGPLKITLCSLFSLCFTNGFCCLQFWLALVLEKDVCLSMKMVNRPTQTRTPDPNPSNISNQTPTLTPTPDRPDPLIDPLRMLQKTKEEKIGLVAAAVSRKRRDG